MTPEQEAAQFATLTETYNAKPAVRPDIAALLDAHKDEADYYKAQGPYVPEKRPEPVQPQPIPGVFKGIALAAPPVGGSVWLMSAGVSDVMNSVNMEVVMALGLGGIVMALLGRSAAKRGPKKTVTNVDLRGSTIRSSSGFTWKSNK